jgi:hypothetical protein
MQRGELVFGDVGAGLLRYADLRRARGFSCGSHWSTERLTFSAQEERREVQHCDSRYPRLTVLRARSNRHLHFHRIANRNWATQ